MWNECKELQEYMIQLRRDLHQIPEVGYDLPETSAYVAAELDRLGIPYERSGRDSSLIAEIAGGRPGKTIALRADMDALPIAEATDIPFPSRHEGRMHGCGHDAHMSMLLGAARVLATHREEIPGTVRLIFQTAEEQSRGAQVVIENGGIDGVDAVFGTHIGSIVDKTIPAGTFIVPSGCCMAAFDKFIIRVKGIGCHGSTPEKGVDPINIAAHIILALQALNAREVKATRPLVLTLGMIQGGSQYNVIPGDVTIEGTIRTLEEDLRQFIARRIGEIAQATAAVFGGSVEYEMVWGAPPVTNEDSMQQLAARAAQAVLGEERVITKLEAPIMGGEDFAYYLEKVPGTFMFLSSSNPAKGTDQPHHCPQFNIDEDVLWMGAAVFVRIVEEFLEM